MENEILLEILKKLPCKENDPNQIFKEKAENYLRTLVPILCETADFDYKSCGEFFSFLLPYICNPEKGVSLVYEIIDEKNNAILDFQKIYNKADSNSIINFKKALADLHYIPDGNNPKFQTDFVEQFGYIKGYFEDLTMQK